LVALRWAQRRGHDPARAQARRPRRRRHLGTLRPRRVGHRLGLGLSGLGRHLGARNGSIRRRPRRGPRPRMGVASSPRAASSGPGRRCPRVSIPARRATGPRGRPSSTPGRRDHTVDRAVTERDGERRV